MLYIFPHPGLIYYHEMSITVDWQLFTFYIQCILEIYKSLCMSTGSNSSESSISLIPTEPP